MIAKCVFIEQCIDLTIGKEYEVIDFDNFFGRVRLKGDEGEMFWYHSKYVEVWEG